MFVLGALCVPVQITAIISCFGLILLLSKVAYQIWIHPLRQYPGPFLGKITYGYAAYHSWKGDFHLDVWRCHEKYGECIRYGPNILLFNTSTALNTIYKTGKNVQKSKGYLAMMARVPNTLTQRDKILHAQQRRVLAHGFTDVALTTYEDIIRSHCMNLCTRMEEIETDAEGWSMAQNMSKWSNYLSFDMMLEIIYDAKSEMVNKPDNRHLLDMIAISNVRVGAMIPLHSYKGSYLDFVLFRSAIKARYEFIGFIKDLLNVKSREVKPPQQRRSVYDILMSARDGEGLTPIEIAAESTNLIVAGFDTTATSIAACFFYLTRYPAVYAKVSNEVRTQITSIEDICSKSVLNKCTYLRACLTESMRMAPAVAAVPGREVEAGGVLVDGHALPSGCDVGTGIYAIHHNKRYYPDPFTFRPERWIVGDQAEGFSCKRNVDIAYSAFMAFGKGSRTCIGRPLAMLESMTFMAIVLYGFNFRKAEGDVGKLGGGVLGAEFGRHRPLEYQLYDHVTAVCAGPMLQFRKRHIE